MKKVLLTSLFTLSLLGTSLSSPVSANDRVTGTKNINGDQVNILSSEVSTASNGNTLVGIQGEFLTPNKQDILNQINSIRKEAYDEGLVSSYVPIKWSTKLENTAFSRAAEASITIHHKRLSSQQIWSAFPSGNTRFAENLAWNYDGFSTAIQQWYSEKADFIKQKNGQPVSGQTGHYKNIINPKNTRMGLAAFSNPAQKNGWISTAQVFGNLSDSEELTGGYGPAIQFTEATTSRLQEFASKANLFDQNYNAIGTHSSSKTSSPSTKAPVGNWKRSGSSWWYEYSTGTFASNGWKQIDGNWYFFDRNGWMQTGWITYNGSWYYLESSGAMKTGWLFNNGQWYFLDNSGAMKTGWIQVNGKWYYAYASGALAVNTTTPDGYKVNASGEMV